MTNSQRVAVVTTVFMAGVFWAAPALAVPITVANFSFENPGGVGPPTDWTVTSPSGGAEPVGGGSFTAAAHGSQYLYLNLPDFGGPNPSFAVSNFGLIGSAAVGTYTLTVAGGRRSNGATTDGSYVVELLAGGSVIGSQTVLDPFNSYAADTWNDITAMAILNAGSGFVGQDLAIRLSAFNGTGTDLRDQGQFDNVRLDFEAAAVPEATTSLLLGTGVLALIASRRRKSRK